MTQGRSASSIRVGITWVIAAVSLAALAGCTPSSQTSAPENSVAEPAASIEVSGYGFTVEEVTDDLVLPYGIAVGPDNTTYLVAGEEDARYLVVWQPDVDEWHIVTAAEAGLNDPRHVSVSPEGDVFIANAGNNTISVSRPGGTSWSTIESPDFDRPVSVAIGAAGELAVVNAGNASIAVSLDGGDDWQVFGSDLTGLSAPTAIDITPNGTVVITDAAEDAVALGVNGGEHWAVIGREAGFSAPVSVDSSPDGTIYVANFGDGSLSWSTNHGQSWRHAPQFGEVVAVAVGPDGSLFLSDGLSAAARVSTIPGAVEGLTATQQGSEVTVHWQHPRVTGGQAITGYVVSLVAADGSSAADDFADELTELIEAVDASTTSITFSDIALTGLIAVVQANNVNGPGAENSAQVTQ